MSNYSISVHRYTVNKMMQVLQRFTESEEGEAAPPAAAPPPPPPPHALSIKGKDIIAKIFEIFFMSNSRCTRHSM